MGNVIAETNGVATGTVREYIWLPETQIAPMMAARAQVDRPLAVVDAVNTASPVTWWVTPDHLNRPVLMTDAAKAQVWQAVWKPFGEAQSITGPAALDNRFPGQWFQMESGLHYNWYRHYDPTVGRYTQPDPNLLDDGASVYSYSRSNVISLIDKFGLQSSAPSTDEYGNRICPNVPLPPGDCSFKEQQDLQDKVDTYCGKEGCNFWDSLTEMQSKLRRSISCAAARSNINKKCFKGGNSGHRIAEHNAWRSAAWCTFYIVTIYHPWTEER